MKITAWLRNALNTLRNWLIQIMGLPRALWQGVRTRGAALFGRSNRAASPQAESGGAAGPTNGTHKQGTGTIRWLKLRAGLHRYILRPVGKGFTELWQLIKPLFARFARQGQDPSGLTLRKIGVKPSYRYNLDPNPLRQLLADGANALAMGIGLGAWPYQRAWFAESLPPILASHYWILSALLSALPLIVFYVRWQYVRQHGPSATWDLLTIATGLIGLLLALFAGTLLFDAFTALTAPVVAMVWASLAIAAWLVGEGANLYAILIRRPYPMLAVLSLSKSLLFILSGWLILLYLLLVNLFASAIQLESAAFLFAIFQTTGIMGVLLALGEYGVRRFQHKLPRFAAIAN